MTGISLLGDASAHAAALARAALARGAQQLSAELDATAAIGPQPCTVAVVGERSRGKSTLLNALLERPRLLPAAVDVTTNTHVVIVPAAPGRFSAERATVTYGDGVSEMIELTELAQFASEAENPHNERGVQRIDVAIHSSLLAEGFRFLDTPGVGGLISSHGEKTMDAIAEADGLIMVLESDRPMSQPEIEFVANLASRVTRVVFVHNRRVASQEDQEIVDANRRALHRLAPALAGAPMLTVSAHQAERSVDERASDPEYASELFEESGLTSLLDALREEIRGGVILEQAGLVLGRTAVALKELASPDEELVRAGSAGESASGRLRGVNERLRLLRDHPPATKLEQRVNSARGQVRQSYKDELDELRQRTLLRIDREWSRDLGAALPDEMKMGVDTLWAQATHGFTTRLVDATSEIFADYKLGAAGGAAPPTGERTEVAVASSSGASGHLGTRLGGGMQLAVIGVQTLLRAFGIPADWVPAVVVGLALAGARGQMRVGEQSDARTLVETKIRAAHDAFATAFDDYSAEQSGRWKDKLDSRCRSRVESLEATATMLEALRDRAQGAAVAREHLAALEPLRRRQEDLEGRLSPVASWSSAQV